MLRVNAASPIATPAATNTASCSPMEWLRNISQVNATTKNVKMGFAEQQVRVAQQRRIKADDCRGPQGDLPGIGDDAQPVDQHDGQQADACLHGPHGVVVLARQSPNRLRRRMAGYKGGRKEMRLAMLRQRTGRWSPSRTASA